MRALQRQIARLRTVWLWIAVGIVVTDLVLRFTIDGEVPFLALLPTLVAATALSIIPPPAPVDSEPVPMAPPVRGQWVPINSPGSQVPSHGTRAMGQKYAVDILHPSTPDTPGMPTQGLRPNRPEDYSCFGDQVQAMADGTVLRAVDRWRDHRARNTWPTLIFMMTIEGLVRSLGGMSAITGNHVVVRHDDGRTSLYAHLRRGSVLVAPGQRVTAGEVLAQVGNTGNTSEPHLHVQLMEHPSAMASSGLPMCWEGVTHGDRLDDKWGPQISPPKSSAIPGVPPNGVVMTVG